MRTSALREHGRGHAGEWRPTERSTPGYRIVLTRTAYGTQRCVVRTPSSAENENENVNDNGNETLLQLLAIRSAENHGKSVRVPCPNRGYRTIYILHTLYRDVVQMLTLVYCPMSRQVDST